MSVFLYISIILFWGLTWFASKSHLGVVPIEISIINRFVIAASVLGLFMLIRGGRFKFSWPQHVWVALLGALLFCTNFFFLYRAMAYLSSGLVAIVFSTSVIMIMLNSIVFLKKRIAPRMIMGAVLGVLGLCCVFLPEIEGLTSTDETFLGLLLALVGAYSFAWANQISLICAQRDIPVLSATFFGMLYGVFFMSLYCFVSGIQYTLDLSPTYLASVLYLAIPGSVFAFLAYLALVKRLGPEKASYITLFFPVVALITSTFLEGFEWVMEDFVGVGLILLGNALVLIKPRFFFRAQAKACS